MIGHVNNELALADAGVSSDQQVAERVRQLQVALEDGRFPRLAEVLAESGGGPGRAPDFDRLAGRTINGLVAG